MKTVLYFCTSITYWTVGEELLKKINARNKKINARN